jgi:hypothetical protein
MEYLELLDKLKHVDEVTLMELLEITSEDMVEKFSDKINENLDRLYRHLNG